jgi:hypothetical protein
MAHTFCGGGQQCWCASIDLDATIFVHQDLCIRIFWPMVTFNESFP